MTYPMSWAEMSIEQLEKVVARSSHSSDRKRAQAEIDLRAALRAAATPRFGAGDVVKAEDGSPLFGIVSKVEFGKATVQTSQGVVERSVSKWEKVLSIAEYVTAKEGA
jgi:hypothetical protein